MIVGLRLLILAMDLSSAPAGYLRRDCQSRKRDLSLSRLPRFRSYGCSEVLYT
jgi:hypothetical protein